MFNSATTSLAANSDMKDDMAMSPFVSRLLPSAPDSCSDSCCQPADSCRHSCLLDRPDHGLAADVHSALDPALDSAPSPASLQHSRGHLGLVL